MAFADSINPFFSFVDGLSGIPVIAFLGTPSSDGRVPFEILQAGRAPGNLDAGVAGHWVPASGLLVIDGEISSTITDVETIGRYLVIEKDGGYTIEKTGERHLEEGEILVTQGFLDSVPVGSRHDHLKLSAAADDDGAGPDDDLDATGVNGAGIGHR